MVRDGRTGICNEVYDLSCCLSLSHSCARSEPGCSSGDHASAKPGLLAATLWKALGVDASLRPKHTTVL